MKPPLPQESMDYAFFDEVQKYNAMAKVRLLDAMEATIFMCGMAPLNSDDPCHAIHHRDPSLNCDTHIESEFYTFKIHLGRINIWCHCAGTNESPVNLNSSLKAL